MLQGERVRDPKLPAGGYVKGIYIEAVEVYAHQRLLK